MENILKLCAHVFCLNVYVVENTHTIFIYTHYAALSMVNLLINSLHCVCLCPPAVYSSENAASVLCLLSSQIVLLDLQGATFTPNVQKMMLNDKNAN